jgi:TM2 domain-containing membrane protein YozV
VLERFRSTENDPVVALVLNLLVCGCGGYVYLGQTRKAVIALVLWLIGVPLTCGAGSGVVALIAAIDAYRQAERMQRGAAG